MMDLNTWRICKRRNRNRIWSGIKVWTTWRTSLKIFLYFLYPLLIQETWRLISSFLPSFRTFCTRFLLSFATSFVSILNKGKDKRYKLITSSCANLEFSSSFSTSFRVSISSSVHFGGWKRWVCVEDVPFFILIMKILFVTLIFKVLVLQIFVFIIYILITDT